MMCTTSIKQGVTTAGRHITYLHHISSLQVPCQHLQRPITAPAGPIPNHLSYRHFHITPHRSASTSTEQEPDAPQDVSLPTESSTFESKPAKRRSKRGYTSYENAIGKSMTTQLAVARAKGRIANWQAIEDAILNRGESYSGGKQRLSVENVEKAIQEPIRSSLLFRYRGESAPQWSLQLPKRQLSDRGFEGFSHAASGSGVGYSWTKSVLPTVPPPSDSYSDEGGVFARPTISYAGMESRGMVIDEAARLLPEWMAWCVVEVGKRIKDMSTKGNEEVVEFDMTAMLNDVFVEEARKGEIKTGGRPRTGLEDGLDGFRLRWRWPLHPSIVFQRRDHQYATNKKVHAAGLWIPDKWSKQDAFRAVGELQNRWIETKDLNVTLEDWAYKVDKDLGY